MKKLALCLAVLSLLAAVAFAQPYPFDVNTYNSDFSVEYTILYNGSAVPAGKLVQVIKPGTNNVLDAPNLTTNLGALGGDDILNSSFAVGDGVEGGVGVFVSTLTGLPSTTGATASSLVSGNPFYLRVWADVNATASTPYAAGSHWKDLGPFTTSTNNIYDINFGTVASWSVIPSLDVQPIISVTMGGNAAAHNSTYDFGSHLINNDYTATLAVANGASATVNLTGTITVAGTGFTGTVALTSTAPGASHNYTITWHPTAAVAATGSVTIANNSSNQASYVVNLSGTGTPPPAGVSVTEGGNAVSAGSTADFGTVELGANTTKTYRITNTGGSTLSITSFSATGDYSCATGAQSINAGSYYDAVVTFTPSANGTRTGTFSFDHSATGSPWSISLTGTGHSAPVVAVTEGGNAVTAGSTVAFGTVDRPGSTTKTFRISNSGNAALTITGFLATGDFSCATGAQSVAAGSYYDAVVTFTPSADGARSGSFEFSHNATNVSSPWGITVSGTGNTVNPYGPGNPPVGSGTNPGGGTWNPTLPGDPNSGGNPPAGFTFTGTNQPSSFTFTYVTTVPPSNVFPPVPGWLGNQPANSTNAIQRFFEVNLTGGTNFSCDLDLYFTSADVPAGMDPLTANLVAWFYHNPTWSWYIPTISLVSPGLYRAHITGITGFSVISLNVIPATPVTAFAFDANSSNNAVTLHWSTATERNNDGFIVERRASNSEPFVQIAFVNSRSANGNSDHELNYYYEDRYNVNNGTTYQYRIADRSLDGAVVYHNQTVSSTPRAPVVNEYSLSNYPNPFNPETKINFAMKAEGKVKLYITNVMGQTVATLLNNEVRSVGFHTVSWDASKLPSGIYFLKMETNGYNTMRKLVLSK